MSQPQIAIFLHELRLALGEIEGLQIPTIAALDGVALGGGLELALACDFRVAGEWRAGATKLGLPETRLAILPGAGGTQRLSRLVGPTKAKELIFSGRPLSPVEAEKYGDFYSFVCKQREPDAYAHSFDGLGIVSYVADTGQTATERAILLAEEFLNSGPLAIRAAKRAIDTGSRLDMYETAENMFSAPFILNNGISPRESGLDLEWLCYQTIIPTKDRLEGLAAFAEKRKPVYKGE
ncbi:hypothetical protein P7C70_g406, partial [Phenoliferia sp. Uapishka_3]